MALLSKGHENAPLIIGELLRGDSIHVFESQWDSFAFMDVSGERSGIIITRGASNGALVADVIPKDATVYCWMQNDAAGEKWQRDICSHVKNCVVKSARTPAKFKDVNQWVQSDGTSDDLLAAMMEAEVVGKTEAPSANATPVQPRALGLLLDAVCGLLRRYVVFSLPEQAFTLALWVAHTCVIEAFDFTPYIHIFSAEKRWGKSRLLDVLELLVKAPWRDGGLTEAVLFRRIKRDLPTLLADEIDTVFHAHKNDGMENIRRMFNLGFTRGYQVSRCVGTNTKFEIEEFDPFCAKALCGIGRCLPDTVSDRCIPIELVRQSREEKAERFRKRDAVAETSSVKRELEAWAQQSGVIDALRAARPHIPGELQDRAEEICEPLVAIADMAGGDWPEKARVAVVKLCVQDEDASIGVKLLADIRGIFEEKKTDKLPTKDILEALVAVDDAPFALWWLDDLKHDKLQKPATRLAKLLKPYGVKPCQIRAGDETVKGYHKSAFKEAFGRYLSPSLPLPPQAETAETAETNSLLTREKDVSHTSDQAETVSALAEAAETQFSLVERQNVSPVSLVSPFRCGEGRSLWRPMRGS
jgi:hypothetical protein